MTPYLTLRSSGSDAPTESPREIDVASQGHTIDEALANLAEAVELYLEEVDDPAGHITATPLVTSTVLRSVRSEYNRGPAATLAARARQPAIRIAHATIPPESRRPRSAPLGVAGTPRSISVYRRSLVRPKRSPWPVLHGEH
jgi:hypothetical protein